MSLKYIPGKTSCFDAVNYMLKHVRQFVMNHKAHGSRFLLFVMFYCIFVHILIFFKKKICMLTN